MSPTGLPFCTEFDARMAECGPPAVFTVDAKGQLCLDVVRTREHWGRVDAPVRHEACHCLFRDRATGWVQYALATSPQLCSDHPHADIARFPDAASALAVLARCGDPPMWKADFPPSIPDGSIQSNP